jgi:hypothetical protein
MTLAKRLLPIQTSTLNTVDFFGNGSGVELYRFENNLLGEAGLYSASGTNVTYTTGKFGDRVSVTSGKIDLGSGSKALMPHDGNYSISAWIYNSGTASRRVIASRMNASVSTGYGDNFVYDSDNTIAFQKVYAPVGGGTESLTYTPSFSVGWHHVGLSFKRSSNTASIYTDGVLRATKNNWNTGSFDNNLNTLIGAYHNANYNAYQDQTRFFNVALSDAEMLALFNES